MKKIVTIFAFLLTVISLHAQEMQVKVYINGSVNATTENEDVIQLSGCLTMPATAIDSIVYVLKDIDNLDFVDLGTGDGILWANMNYGATEPTDAGELLPWARIGEVYEKWGKPWDRYVQAPTLEQINNLRNNCDWESVSENGNFIGFNVFKKDRTAHIFLPVTGLIDPEDSEDKVDVHNGYYWTATKSSDDQKKARAMYFGANDSKGSISERVNHYRTYYYAIRPVKSTTPPVSASVDEIAFLDYSNRTATFSIRVSVEGEGAQLGDYGIEYRLTPDGEWQTQSANGQNTVLVMNLSSGTYEYRGYAMVQGATDKFYSHESNFPTFEVPQVTAKVNSISFIEYKNRVARFNISASVEGDGTLGHYGVEYRLHPNGEWQFKEHTSANMVEVSGLTPGTYDYRGYAMLQGSTAIVYSPLDNYDTFDVPQNSLTLHADVVEGSLRYNRVTICVWPEADDISAFQLGEWGVYFNTDQSKMGSLSSIKAGEGNLSAQGSSLTLEVDPQKTYYYRAYAVVDGVGTMGEDSLSFTTPIKPDFVEPDSIDLGLPSGTLWASFNLGAEDVYDAGNYYGWGDPTGTVIKLGAGFYAADIFEAADISKGDYVNYDIVHTKLQGNWHMPDTTQLRELMVNCHFNYVQNYNDHAGLNGYVVTGMNGNKLFLPAASYATAYNDEWQPKTETNTGAYYWSSILDGDITNAYYAKFGQGRGAGSISKNPKSHGYLIRPVIPGSGNQQLIQTDDPRAAKDEKAADGESIIPQAGIDMGMRTVYWSYWNLGATEITGSKSIGKHYAWGEVNGGKDFYTGGTYVNGYGNELGTAINNYTGTVGSDHDAAAHLWEDGWRMPTQDEINQLITECSWSYDVVDGVPGILFTDDNMNGYHNHATNNSIFFPFDPYRDDSGYSDERLGGYWTSTRWDDGDQTQKRNYATFLQFQKVVDSNFQTTIELSGLKGYWRFAGMLIRPVKDLPSNVRQVREAYFREMESRRNANLNE